MTVARLAAFSDAGKGGNPAGVMICDHFPGEAEMRRIAAEVGYSETAFAMPDDGRNRWRVRYFSPESEVPFCGHATIALGAALARHTGNQRFALRLNDAEITVETAPGENGEPRVALQSPPTRSGPVRAALLEEALALFGYHSDQLNPALPPAEIHAGADHLLLALTDRADLAAMSYDLARGRDLMRANGLVTIMLVHVRGASEFDVRNAFASGGVLEDPATGAAAAAFAGYLRDLGWPHGNRIRLVQGEDMGIRSLIEAEFDDTPGSSVRITGATRPIG